MTYIKIIPLIIYTLFFTPSIYSQTISGQIKDEHGSVVYNVKVMTEDSLQLGSSDYQGYFKIEVSNIPTEVLLQKPGYIEQKITVSRLDFLNIVFYRKTQTISGVTVFGQNRNETDYNKAFEIVDIKGEKLINTFESNPINALRARVPGMQMTTTAGGVTSGSGMVIRGMKSIMGGNQPLFVIDGIPIENESSGANQYGGQDWGNSLKELNAYDIETVQVLKSAAATNKYGSRGMNGVIEIVTKGNAIPEGFSVETNVGNSMGTSYSNPSLLRQETIAQINDPRLAWLSTASQNYIQSFQSSNSQIGNIAFNYYKGKNKLRLSYTADYNKGTYQHNTLDKNNLMLKSSHEWSPKLLTEIGLIYNNSISRNAPSIGAQKFVSIGRSFIEYPIDFSSTSQNDPLENETAWYLYGQNAKKTAQSLRAYTQSYWQISPHWQVTLGANFSDYTIRTNESAAGFIERILGNESLYHQERAYRNTAKENTMDFMVKAALRFHKKWEKHQIGADLRYDYWQTYGSISGEALTPTDSNPYRFRNGDEKRVIDQFMQSNQYTTSSNFLIQNANQKSIHGTQFNVQYKYGENLFLNSSTRLEQVKTVSNLNQLGNLTLFYPSVGVAYFYTQTLRNWFNIDDRFLSSAKIRANFGKSGNVTGLFHYQSAVTDDLELPYPSHRTLYKPYYTNSGSWGLQNYQTGFSYEDALEMEIGTNLSLWKERVNLGITWYNRLINNYLYDIISPLEQYNNPLRSVFAQVRNRGWEIQMMATPVLTKSFSWNSTLNFSTNSNLFTQIESSGGNQSSLGASQNDVSLMGSVNSSFGTMLSSYARKVDAQGRSILNAALEYSPVGMPTIIGNATPKWIAGFENGFTFKNFNINTLLDVKYGGDIYSGTYALLYQRAVLENTAFGRSASLGGVERKTATTLTNPETGETNTVYRSTFDGVIPSGVFDQDVILYGKTVGGLTFDQAQQTIGKDANGEYLLQPISASDYYAGFHDRAGVRNDAVFENTFIALREVSLGYSLPSHLSQKWLHSKQVQLGLVGRNLGYIFRSLPYNLNPDGAYNNRSGGAFEYASLLPVRTFGFFLKLNF